MKTKNKENIIKYNHEMKKTGKTPDIINSSNIIKYCHPTGYSPDFMNLKLSI